MTFNLLLLGTLVITMCSPICVTNSASAQESRKQIAGAALGFDESRIPPPNKDKDAPIARVMYEYIYRADLNPPNEKGASKKTSEPLSDAEADILRSRVLSTLQHVYLDKQQIEATDEEVQQYVAAMEATLKGIPTGLSKVEMEQMRQMWKVTGSQAVRSWKFDRALHEKYGGRVIFQQANPLEPVGANQRFLTEAENDKVLQIFSEANREEFWEYFKREHPFEADPKDVDFTKPWWLQKE